MEDFTVNTRQQCS